MAPLDTGSMMNMRLVDPLGDRIGPSPNDYATTGEFLRAIREHKGQTLDELAKSTRIRRAYLVAIEEGDRSSLPARPFAIGYVRSYAQALGIDGDAAAARFKRETPEHDEPFRDPVGVAHDKPKRSPLILAVVGLVLSGVVLWNVVQRAMVQEDRDTGGMPAAAAGPAAPAHPNTVLAIGASTPAPAAQNLPEPYTPPGLPLADGTKAPVVQAASVAAAAAAIPTVFTPKGAIYGAPTGNVVLQAIKPSSLIVRGAGGAVYFARQLAAGEAFRAPPGEGLTADVADPAAFALYVYGQSKGPLVSAQTALDKLAVAPPAAPAAASKASGPAAPALNTAVARPAVRRPRPVAAPAYAPVEPRAEPGPGQVAYYAPTPR